MHVVVVGAGVSGLSCGIRLLQRGHRVTVRAESRTPDTTSDRSAAAFTPFRAGGGERLRRWTRRSYVDLNEIARTDGRESGVRSTTMTEFYFEPFAGDPWWFDLVDEGERLRDIPDRYQWGVRVRVPAMDMTRYMPWLERRFLSSGGTIVDGRVDDLRTPFHEGADVVVNTTGLGARRLVPDAHMTPVRGQIVCVPNDIGLDACLADSGQAGETTYVFAFDRHVVMGGTYEKGVDVLETDERALERIVERGRTLLRETGHARWNELARTRLRTWAGLRPARSVNGNDVAIRLELERLDGEFPVVHDYGHAGIGVTVSWGCAEEVVELVESAR